jgi:hypothetical protein
MKALVTCNHAVNVYALITKKSAGDKIIFVIINYHYIEKTLKLQKDSSIHVKKEKGVKCTMFILLQMSEFFPQILF